MGVPQIIQFNKLLNNFRNERHGDLRFPDLGNPHMRIQL